MKNFANIVRSRIISEISAFLHFNRNLRKCRENDFWHLGIPWSQNFHQNLSLLHHFPEKVFASYAEFQDVHLKWPENDIW